MTEHESLTRESVGCVAEVRFDPAIGWLGRCCCGWSGLPRAAKVRAHTDAVRHAIDNGGRGPVVAPNLETEGAAGDPPNCTGGYQCPANFHLHGCHKDRDGYCTDPEDHAEPIGECRIWPGNGFPGEYRIVCSCGAWEVTGTVQQINHAAQAHDDSPYNNHVVAIRERTA